ncbi:MAG: carcinine hydrolase/isopenicillin-N N-acyltransferase family protein [Dehalobacterium sp.]
MCTCGVVSAKTPSGERISLLVKTMDFPISPCWHGVAFQPGGWKFIAMGLTGQIGINSGVNEAGLGVALSFLDYRGPFEDDGKSQKFTHWLGDERGLANTEIMSHCQSVEEAIEYLYEFVKDHPLPGGNHMLVDATGKVANFEHCNGQAAHKIYEEGFTARGNNGLIILQEEQAVLPELVKFDRKTRYSTMLDFVEQTKKIIETDGSREKAIAKMQEALSTHSPEGNDWPGTICTHGNVLPGGRANLAIPMYTVSGIVFDVTNKELIYTRGNPCENEWLKLSI